MVIKLLTLLPIVIPLQYDAIINRIWDSLNPFPVRLGKAMGTDVPEEREPIELIGKGTQINVIGSFFVDAGSMGFLTAPEGGWRDNIRPTTTSTDQCSAL
jgi:hypothetical protein